MDLQRKNSHYFVEWVTCILLLIIRAHVALRWIPDNVSVSLCSVPPVGLTQARMIIPYFQELIQASLGGNCFGKLYVHPRTIQAKSHSGAISLPIHLQ